MRTYLKSYKDIVIKKADMGSAVVVRDMEDYCKEARASTQSPSTVAMLKCFEMRDYNKPEFTARLASFDVIMYKVY